MSRSAVEDLGVHEGGAGRLLRGARRTGRRIGVGSLALARGVVRLRRVWVPTALAAGLVVAFVTGARMLVAPAHDDAGPATVCWDGTDAPVCALPDGDAGLAYVFPALSAGDPACHRVSTTPLVWTCALRRDGATVSVSFLRRDDVTEGLRRLRAGFGGAAPARIADGERLLWRRTRPVDGRWAAVEAYARAPFSVSVSAPTRAAREAVLADLRFRPYAQLRERPAS